MDTRKILIATDAWHPQINGVVTTLSSTVERLRSRGHTVRTFRPDQFHTIPCPTYPDIRLSLAGKGSALQVLQGFQPHAVHIATEGPLGWAMWRACRTIKQPFTTSYHTRFPEYIRLRVPVPLAITYPVVRAFHSGAVRTMVATEDMEQDLRNRDFSHLVRWSRGVNTELFKPRHKEYLPGKRPLAMYVGRVAVEKNLESFLSFEFPGCKYVIGEGPARESLAKKYSHVRFTGAKQGRELACHMAAADVFVFPSLTDTFGVVMLEAGACGVPVAAFPVTGPINVVKEGINGCLDENLQEAVGRALRVDPVSCRNYASQYSWDACTDQFYSNLAFNSRTGKSWN